MTRNKVLAACAVIPGLLIAAIPVLAHHGRAGAYNTRNPVTSKATVANVAYANPHVQLYFDTKDAQGKVTHWNGEMTDIGQLTRAGWNRKRFMDALKTGTTINVTYQVATSPQPPGQGVALVMRITDEKGEPIGLVRRGAGGQE
jgi:hypothetical protein